MFNIKKTNIMDTGKCSTKTAKKISEDILEHVDRFEYLASKVMADLGMKSDEGLQLPNKNLIT